MGTVNYWNRNLYMSNGKRQDDEWYFTFKRKWYKVKDYTNKNTTELKHI